MRTDRKPLGLSFLSVSTIHGCASLPPRPSPPAIRLLACQNSNLAFVPFSSPTHFHSPPSVQPRLGENDARHRRHGRLGDPDPVISDVVTLPPPPTQYRYRTCWEVKMKQPQSEGRNTDVCLLDDYASFSKINTQLLNPPTPLKHVPIRIYIPSSPPGQGGNNAFEPNAPGSFKVMQSLVPPRLPNRKVSPCSHTHPPPHTPHAFHVLL